MYYVLLINIVKNMLFSITDTRGMLGILTIWSSNNFLMLSFTLSCLMVSVVFLHSQLKRTNILIK